MKKARAVGPGFFCASVLRAGVPAGYRLIAR